MGLTNCKEMSSAVSCGHCGAKPKMISVSAKYFSGGIGYCVVCSAYGCQGSFMNFLAGTKRGAVATWNELNGEVRSKGFCPVVK